MNISDWLTNAQINMTQFELPGFGYTSERDEGERNTYGNVHEGFYNYLFGATQAGDHQNNESKAEEIMRKLREDFFGKREFEDYTLEVTGHSLGGALSTMFAFRAATAEWHRQDFCVTNISFASPFFGTSEFRRELINLEMRGKIRHLRISNNEDVVTLIPSTTFLGKQYKHVDMNIRLYHRGDFFAPSYRRFYPKEGSFLDGARNTLHANIMLGLSPEALDNHLCPEYGKRLKNGRNELSQLTLDGLYSDRGITGWENASQN